MKIINFSSKPVGPLVTPYIEAGVWFVAPVLEVVDAPPCTRGLRLDQGFQILLGRAVDGLELFICAGAAGTIECFDEQGALMASYSVASHVGTNHIAITGFACWRLTVHVANEGWLSRLELPD